MKRAELKEIKNSELGKDPKVNQLLDWIDKLEDIHNDFKLVGFKHESLLQVRDEMLRTLGDIWE